MDARVLILHISIFSLFGVPSIFCRSAGVDESFIDVGTTANYDLEESTEGPQICSCPYSEVGCDSEIGTYENPLTGPCKTHKIESGSYYMHKKEPFHVFCNMTEKLTCIESERPVIIEYSKHGFEAAADWLSEHSSIDMEYFYGLTSSQISWLQKRSVSAKQTLRVYYENVGMGFDPAFLILGNSINLLTWNDVTIKSFATKESPFFYKIKGEECSPRDEWCYMDLVLVSDRNKRLPVIDVLIETESGRYPRLKFENIELCYG